MYGWTKWRSVGHDFQLENFTIYNTQHGTMKIMGNVTNFPCGSNKIEIQFKVQAKQKTFMMILLHEDCVNMPSKLWTVFLWTNQHLKRQKLCMCIYMTQCANLAFCTNLYIKVFMTT